MGYAVINTGNISIDLNGTWMDLNGGTKLIGTDSKITVDLRDYKEEYGYTAEYQDGRLYVRSTEDYGYFGSMTQLTMMDDGTLAAELMEDDGGHVYSFAREKQDMGRCQ